MGEVVNYREDVGSAGGEEVRREVYGVDVQDVRRCGCVVFPRTQLSAPLANVRFDRTRHYGT